MIHRLAIQNYEEKMPLNVLICVAVEPKKLMENKDTTKVRKFNGYLLQLFTTKIFLVIYVLIIHPLKD